MKPHRDDTDGEDNALENEDKNQRLKDQSNRSNFYKVKIRYYVNRRYSPKICNIHTEGVKL